MTDSQSLNEAEVTSPLTPDPGKDNTSITTVSSNLSSNSVIEDTKKLHSSFDNNASSDYNTKSVTN